MRIRHIAGLLVVALALSGCFKHKSDRENGATGPITLNVDNHNWSDIVVFALVEGTRHPLGSVTATQKARLRVPETLMPIPGSVELVLDPLGSRGTFRTGVIQIGMGQEVHITVENELRMTSWRVQ